MRIVIRIMATITGSRVLLGIFNPGYNYYTPLISYNIVMGLVSIFAGVLSKKGIASPSY